MKTVDRVRARYMTSPVLRSTVFAFLGSIGLAGAGRAAEVTWSVLPDNGVWSNVNNWEGNVVPYPGVDVVFPGSYFDGNLTNDLVTGLAIRSIRFDYNEYTLAGNAITLGEALPFTIGCTTALHRPHEPSSDTVALPIIATSTVLLSTVPGCSLILSGAISGAGGLTASGGGRVILSGDDSYTGSTRTALDGGFLTVNGKLSGTSEVIVEASSTFSKLEGSGTFTAPLSVQATDAGLAVVEPGQAPQTGILSTGHASIGPFASLTVKLNGTVVGTEYDQLNVTGGIALGPLTTLDVASLGFSPAIGAVFTIIRNNTGTPVSGTFLGLPEGSVFAKNTTNFRISYVGGHGHDVVLTVIPTVAAPAALDVDPVGNGVLEEGELVFLEPTWTNTSGAPLHLTGATADFEGPVGPVYDNPDADGDYGTLGNGAAAHCADCYSIQIVSASRPMQHWDATIDETVSPGSITQTWTLHVGDSFPDVPESQPFYAFIENLFHNGVTGGCAGGNYCPDDSVTRAQMAVFLLKGEHGSAYVPPACSATVFIDEPCPGGPFVDWVNQLASENITGGCGGDSYCPGDPVRRGQMAVFLLKGEHGGDFSPPACETTVFSDVPCPGGQFVDWINQLADEAITGGCGGGNFCAGDPVGRAQMAALLVKTFGLVLYGP